MKKLAAITAIALAVSLNSAQAADYDQQVQELVVSGMVESWNGYTIYADRNNLGDSEADEDIFVSGYSGRLSLPLGSNLSGQMDLDTEISSDYLFEGNDDDSGGFLLSYQALFHFNYRDPSTGLIGAFGGFGRGGADGDQYPLYVIGGEAQVYLGNITLYGQGGYLDSDTEIGGGDDDSLRDAIFGRAVARWFVDENSRLQGEFSYANGEVDGDGDEGEIFEWGVRYDTVLGGLPIVGDTNVFVGYRGSHNENVDEGESYMDHTIMVGFRHAFGGNTLLEFDRVGATLDAPNFGRWVGSGNIVD